MVCNFVYTCVPYLYLVEYNTNLNHVFCCIAGFTVTDRGCCGIGKNQGQITCLPFSAPCINRDQHVFWDAYHPTQAANIFLAEKAYSGPPSNCYPMNVKQMANM